MFLIIVVNIFFRGCIDFLLEEIICWLIVCSKYSWKVIKFLVFIFLIYFIFLFEWCVNVVFLIVCFEGYVSIVEFLFECGVDKKLCMENGVSLFYVVC